MSLSSGTASGLHYELAGPEQGSVLVFSHALGGDMTMWDAQVRELAGSYRILRYDTRGHGRSAQPTGSLTLTDLAEDVLQLLDHHSINRGHFCGLSLGGMVGQWLGLHAPERLSSLVLADTAPQMGNAETWDARIKTIQDGGMAAISHATMERWFTPDFRKREAQTVSHFEAVFQATNPTGYIACARVVREGVLAREEFRRFRSVPVPTLVLTGTHDAAATPTDSQFLASCIPDCRYAELPAAHISPVEASAAFTQALRSFLQSQTR
jgi:3-oxoadipate enol-lactonase